MVTPLVLSIVATCLSSIAIVLSTVAIAIFIGLKNSTHKVQYVPIETPDLGLLDKEDKEFMEDHI